MRSFDNKYYSKSAAVGPVGLAEPYHNEEFSFLQSVAKARLKIEWGSQIRSYVLFPYQQVNDHRTEVKTSDVTGVLDGDLDDLIRTYLLKAADAPDSRISSIQNSKSDGR